MATESGGPGAGKRSGRQPPWDKSAEPESASFGTWLRRQRELREISLRDVAERTKISLRYLEAMEEDRFDLLPAPVFAKGFLREYARYVGLSPDEVVNHWLAVQQSGERPEGEEEAASGSGSRRLSRLLLVLVALALVALAAYFLYRQRHRPATPARPAAAAPASLAPLAPESPSPAPPSAAAPAGSPSGSPAARSTAPAASPSPATAAAPPASPIADNEPPPAPLEVNLDFSRECWVEALIDGKKRIAEQRVAGEALRLPAQHTVQITLGDAGAAEVQVNGAVLPLPVTGKGKVLKDFVIDLDTLQNLKAKKETR